MASAGYLEADVLYGAIGEPVSVLAVGAHPDDADLNCGGVLLMDADRGRRTAILDLTLGEAGSRGSVAERRQEALRAAELLGLSARFQLDLGDGRLAPTLERSLSIARVIRQLRPRLIIGPYPADRHPDHEAAGKLVDMALYHAKMRTFDLGVPIWSPTAVWYYNQHIYRIPDVVIDVSGVLARKMAVIQAFQTQLSTPLTTIDPDYIPIGTPDYPFFVETRMRQYGAHIRKPFGEGYLFSETLECRDPLALYDR